ncbi:hypothetical protein ACFFKE_23815 [Streptomyces mutabilis]|uniref:hypothetical protein n=1 Tax=Streptomyces mutabilis TaxID=67332 RepID=UPI001996A905|nr:hypothetical protein [Streptomyces mutabilis]GGQ27607.1 hypothetical protein GCM10010279_39430 [Streptomyces mutabilis]
MTVATVETAPYGLPATDLEDLYRDLHRRPEPGLRGHRMAKKAADAAGHARLRP